MGSRCEAHASSRGPTGWAWFGSDAEFQLTFPWPPFRRAQLRGRIYNRAAIADLSPSKSRPRYTAAVIEGSACPS